MAHMESYDSFQTKKSIEKKKRAKERSSKNKLPLNREFIIKSASNYGIVIEVRYDTAYVLYYDHVVTASLRDDLNYVCNQVLFPGDRVIIDYIKDSYVITNLVSRTTLLSRVKKDSTRLDESVGLTKNVAANIDIAAIVVAAKEPPLHERFIDRYLMILQNSGIQSLICLNKSDLATDESPKLDVYRNIGIPVIETSAKQMIGIENLKNLIIGKQSIFVGNSGVGKSSLINAVMESSEIRTGTVSDKSKRGRHTTTASKYYIWEENSSIIDTPGIRSLDISTFDVGEIQDYFPEFNDWRCLCKYKDCIHFNEPYNVCFVKKGVSDGFINKKRYESYVRIIESLIGSEFHDDIPSQ